ncbi:MAG TPA: DUF6152 family protein [Vicinamibacterales bacterium]|jgi:uncharacterized protein DUF6152
MAKTLCAASLIALLCGGVSTPAHHSVAVNFDSSQVLTLTGRITEIDIRNPHSQITLQVTQPDGTVKEWFIEWSDRNALVRRKVQFQLLRVDDTVTITASPSRRLDNLAYFRTALLPDKSVLRDCGFDAFRQAIATGQFVECEPGRPSSETPAPPSQQREQR